MQEHDALHIAREQLAQAGIAVEWHGRDGLGHGIDPVGQHLARHFMAQTVAGKRSAELG